MIFASSTEERESALVPIGEFQQQDFEAMFEVMDGLPVTIRLLDPPLQEFLPAPDDKAGRVELAADIGVTMDALERRIEDMREVNPMLGFRGCRLGIAYPEIPRAQVREPTFGSQCNLGTPATVPDDGACSVKAKKKVHAGQSNHQGCLCSARCWCYSASQHHGTVSEFCCGV